MVVTGIILSSRVLQLLFFCVNLRQGRHRNRWYMIVYMRFDMIYFLKKLSALGTLPEKSIIDSEITYEREFHYREQ